MNELEKRELKWIELGWKSFPHLSSPTTGDALDLLCDLAFYAACEDAAPKWLIDRVDRSIAKIDNGEARTLDEAFNWERPKGWNQSATRRFSKLRSVVFIEVAQRTYDGEPIGENLFEDIAQRLKEINLENVSGRTVKRIWERAKQEEIEFRKAFPTVPRWLVEEEGEDSPGWAEHLDNLIGVE